MKHSFIFYNQNYDKNYQFLFLRYAMAIEEKFKNELHSYGTGKFLRATPQKLSLLN